MAFHFDANDLSFQQLLLPSPSQQTSNFIADVIMQYTLENVTYIHDDHTLVIIVSKFLFFFSFYALILEHWLNIAHYILNIYMIWHHEIWNCSQTGNDKIELFLSSAWTCLDCHDSHWTYHSTPKQNLCVELNCLTWLHWLTCRSDKTGQQLDQHSLTAGGLVHKVLPQADDFFRPVSGS